MLYEALLDGCNRAVKAHAEQANAPAPPPEDADGEAEKKPEKRDAQLDFFGLAVKVTACALTRGSSSSGGGGQRLNPPPPPPPPLSLPLVPPLSLPQASDLLGVVEKLEQLHTKLHPYQSRPGTYRLDTAAQMSAPKWGAALGWTPREDAMLLMGVHIHGLNNWDKVRPQGGGGVGGNMAAVAFCPAGPEAFCPSSHPVPVLLPDCK